MQHDATKTPSSFSPSFNGQKKEGKGRGRKRKFSFSFFLFQFSSSSLSFFFILGRPFMQRIYYIELAKRQSKKFRKNIYIRQSAGRQW